MSDNFKFDIAGAPLEKMMEIAFLEYRTVTGWKLDGGNKRLTLFWHESNESSLFAVPLGLVLMVPRVQTWLDTKADYGPEPEIDGHCTKGARVFNEAWGHVGGRWEAFVAIEPYWIMHGK